jgi:hypothetical protein
MIVRDIEQAATTESGGNHRRCSDAEDVAW